MLHDSMLSSQNAQAVSDNDLTKRGCVQRPIGAPCSVDYASWLSPLHPFDGHGGCTCGSRWLPEPAHPHSPYQHINAAWELSFPPVASRPCDPESVPGALRHAFGLRSRPGTAGFHARRREGFASSHFFPRSVGFGPTDSSASGAFTIAPSMLCQDHAIPSISSYSAKPLRQSFTNTPFLFHSRKYLCTELALPYSCFGNAFHWHPVRKTKTMAASTFRGSMAFRPAPARRKYLRLLSRLGFGMSGSARSQNSSDIVHDLKAFMAYNVIQTTSKSNHLFTDKHLVRPLFSCYFALTWYSKAAL
jgi:hypothetical protein